MDKNGERIFYMSLNSIHKRLSPNAVAINFLLGQKVNLPVSSIFVTQKHIDTKEKWEDEIEIPEHDR